MKKLVFIFMAGIFILGCSSKTVVKKDVYSVEMQKQNAQKAWKDLDNQ